MADENGGTIKLGERLERIENEIKATKAEVRSTAQALSNRVTKHKEANQAQVAELAKSIVSEFDGRIANLERHDIAEDAVRSYRRWLIGIAITFAFGLTANFIAVVVT